MRDNYRCLQENQTVQFIILTIGLIILWYLALIGSSRIDQICLKMAQDIVGENWNILLDPTDLEKSEQTKRVLEAMRNPNVDILFHPTGRVLQRREAIALDMDKILEGAKQTHTILEIDSIPDRLDLKDEYIRKCSEMGVKMCIDSDAHSVNQLNFLELGIAQARRGWAKKSDIVNTLPLEQFLQTLK